MDITRFLPAESSAGMIEAGAAELTAKVTTMKALKAHQVTCRPQAAAWAPGVTGHIQARPCDTQSRGGPSSA